MSGEVPAEVHDLSELHRALRERSEALNLSRNGLDALAGLETGYSAKVLAQNPAWVPWPGVVAGAPWRPRLQITVGR